MLQYLISDSGLRIADLFSKLKFDYVKFNLRLDYVKEKRKQAGRKNPDGQRIIKNVSHAEEINAAGKAYARSV